MTEKEKFYINKFGTERLILSEVCEILRKPGYSYWSKKLPTIGYEYAFEHKIFPKGIKEGNAYIFLLKDVLEFIDRKHEIK